MSNQLMKLSVNSMDTPMPGMVMGNIERSSVMRTCNDYSERKYTQVCGSAEYPVMDKEIVLSTWEHVAVSDDGHGLTTHDENFCFPIRSTFLMDTSSAGYESILMDDLVNEQSNFELQSAVRNNDQTGSATPGGLGGTDGLRGIIASYPAGAATYAGGVATTAAYGTSGTATTNGLHTLATYDQLTTNGFAVGQNLITYKDVVNFLNAVDINYWDPMNKLYVNTFMVPALRNLTDTNGRPIWIDGLRMSDGFNVDRGAGLVGNLLGHDVYVCPFLDTPWSLTGTAGAVEKFPMVYANWDEFFNTVDSLNLIMRRYDQTLPGSVTYYLERRMVTSVRQPFSGVLYRSTATAGS